MAFVYTDQLCLKHQKFPALINSYRVIHVFGIGIESVTLKNDSKVLTTNGGYTNYLIELLKVPLGDIMIPNRWSKSSYFNLTYLWTPMSEVCNEKDEEK